MDWQRDPTTRFFLEAVRVMKPVLWKRGDCVAWRRLQQDVSISKWTGKESQQRLSFNHVHVMKPVLVQKRRRCSASQVADFWKSFIEDLLRRTDYNIMGLLVESKPKPSPT